MIRKIIIWFVIGILLVTASEVIKSNTGLETVKAISITLVIAVLTGLIASLWVTFEIAQAPGFTLSHLFWNKERIVKSQMMALLDYLFAIALIIFLVYWLGSTRTFEILLEGSGLLILGCCSYDAFRLKFRRVKPPVEPVKEADSSETAETST